MITTLVIISFIILSLILFINYLFLTTILGNCSELIIDSKELSVSYNSTIYNSIAMYSCENGYNLVGVAERTCLSSGNWSGDRPYCQIG